MALVGQIANALRVPTNTASFFSPGKARVNQVSEEHLKMLGECRAIENTSENRVLTSSFLCIVEIKIY